MPSIREAARLRKQRQRERQREAARLAAIAQAEKQEANDEHLAPSVMRNAVVSKPVKKPDGTVLMEAAMLIGPRVQIVNGRAMRADPIATTKHPDITDAHRRAARQLQLDWNDVGAGVGVGAVDYLRSGGSGTGEGGHTAMMAQVAARMRLEAATAFLGAFAPSIARVVLDGVPISVWVKEPDPFGTPERTVAEGVAWIAAALTRLVAYYDPPSTARGVRIRAIGPAREAYGVEVEAA